MRLYRFAPDRDALEVGQSSHHPGQLDRSDTLSPVFRRTLQSALPERDQVNAALREYRQKRRSRSTVVVPSISALQQLVASGTVFRIDPVPELSSTAPGSGVEPDRPLPENMQALPTVGVVDGGLSAASYIPAQAWSAPKLVPDSVADVRHGNLVSSLIVQGHDWNNNLTLPALYCQIGTVQAVSKVGVRHYVSPGDFITYLDAVMSSRPETKVWNFSLNQRVSCDPDQVSYLGHEIALLARKHGVLPVISIGNKPGDRLQPPADCEAGLTVGGRLHNDNGAPAGACPACHSGPGPSCMLKPETSHFSRVRALGGGIITGSSFAAALSSPLAAHTMARLREPSPDLVKALLIHNAEGEDFDEALGFGTPGTATLPWECRPGTVTLQWVATLRPGANYYWELPIPPSLRKTGKLRGSGALTVVLNPHPMVSDYAGPNYFSARIASALQYGKLTPDGELKYPRLLGSLDTERLSEEDARTLDHKWSPVRHDRQSFKSKGFDGDIFRIYARVYTRDLYLYGYHRGDEVPELNAVFVLSLGTGDQSDDLYSELRSELGAFVENATVETDIELNNEGDI